jgi:hypothetical protein
MEAKHPHHNDIVSYSESILISTTTLHLLYILYFTLILPSFLRYILLNGVFPLKFFNQISYEFSFFLAHATLPSYRNCCEHLDSTCCPQTPSFWNLSLTSWQCFTVRVFQYRQWRLAVFSLPATSCHFQSSQMLQKISRLDKQTSPPTMLILSSMPQLSPFAFLQSICTFIRRFSCLH